MYEQVKRECPYVYTICNFQPSIPTLIIPSNSPRLEPQTLIGAICRIH